MAKPKSHHTPHPDTASKSTHEGASPQPQKSTPPPTQRASSQQSSGNSPAFTAANKSLQGVSTPPVSTTSPKSSAAVAPKEEVELAPQFAAPKKASAPKSSSPKMATQGVLPAQVVREANTKRSGASSSKRVKRVNPATWVGAGLGALLLVVGGAAAGAYSRFAASDAIAPGVFIAGVPVGGLTPDGASAVVAEHFGSPNISLLCDGTTVSVPVSKLGMKLSIEPTVKKAYAVGRDGLLPNNLLRVYGSSSASKNFMLPIEWDKKQLVKELRDVNKKVAVAPVNARLRGASEGLEVVPDRAGRELNTGAAAHLLQKKFFVGMPSLHVPSRSVEAKVTSAALDGYDVQLGQYTTSFNAGLAGRCANLRVACRAIQNRVLMPGDTFSFNACTGERTADKGYRMAHIFLRQPGAAESEVVEGLAGGVCQVSSTLFNAVRKTNAAADVNPIKIVERTTHSLPVTYVPRGLDATVAWPYKDLKFRNVTDHPVYVRTQMGRSRLNISVWSRLPKA